MFEKIIFKIWKINISVDMWKLSNFQEIETALKIDCEPPNW